MNRQVDSAASRLDILSEKTFRVTAVLDPTALRTLWRSVRVPYGHVLL